MLNQAFDFEDDEDYVPTARERCLDWLRETFEITSIFQAATIFIIISVIWGIAYSIFGEKVGVYSQPFSLLVLFTAAKALGIFVELIKIPQIIGMISMGVILKNVGFVNITGWCLIATAYLRKITLLSILLPAAFSLDPEIMRTMFAIILCGALIPAIIEVGTVSLMSYLLLELPPLWFIVLGLIMSAASPAIVVPCLFSLEDQGYGNVNGVHTIITASCILCVISSVTVFGLVYGILTATEHNFIRSLWKGPVEILIGIAYGIVMGITAQYFPHEDEWFLTTLRSIFIAGGSFLALFGSHAIDYSGAGVLGCFTFGFIANLRWRKTGWSTHNPVRENYKLFWRFFEPISFSLIGIEVNFQTLKIKDCLLGSAVMICGVVAHVGSAFAVIKFFGYPWKQNLFIALTFMSKATVQAALGPLAIDYARQVDDPKISEYAQTILTVSVVSIALTSPFGIVLLLQLGPKLLTKQDEPTDSIRNTSLGLFTEPDHVMRRETRLLSMCIKNNLRKLW